jgi:hypothetical protein
MNGRRAISRTDLSDRRSDSSETTSEDREVDEVGDESFPASDPPQWWTGRSSSDDAADE